MPTYDFRCKQCGATRENVLLRISHDECDRPHCCGAVMAQHFTVPPMVHWNDPQIEPFRAVGIPGQPIVTSTKQNRELMARHDLVDANDLGPPPTHKDDLKVAKQVERSIKAITPDAETSAKMEKQGLMDPSTQEHTQ